MSTELNLTDTLAFKLSAAKTKFTEQIIEKLENVDIDAEIVKVIENLHHEIKTIADALLGIDRSWSRLELRDGLIREQMRDRVNEALDKVLAPKIVAAVEKQLTLKSINERVNRAVEEGIEQRMRDMLNTYGNNSALRKEVDRRVDAFVQEIIK